MRAATVHPRVCGERACSHASNERVHGSSPRVRGTHPPDIRAEPLLRFIPACAGNASGRSLHSAPTAVHPRVCGERTSCATDSLCAAGSSPRVRGTPRRFWRCRRNHRFIPACAGNARRAARRTPARSVHPRVCGERVRPRRSGISIVGSSPRVRGTPGLSRPGQRIARFIPACAGNAQSTAARGSPRSVHPRVCGERPLTLATASFAAGSSPRVRGTL